MAGLDTRSTHFTAIVEINEVTTEGIVSATGYKNDGHQHNRSVEQVAKVVLRASTQEALVTKINSFIQSGAL